MNGAQVLVVVFCGLLIGLAVFFLIRLLRNIARGRCCTGCRHCPHTDICGGSEEQSEL